MRDAVRPHRDFYVIKVHALEGIFSAVPGGHTEKLWREFFVDPSHWWDHRPEKTNERYPDFKHKKTGEALWIEDRRNPAWVAGEMAAMAPGRSSPFHRKFLCSPLRSHREQWPEFFRNPSQCRDQRSDKLDLDFCSSTNERYPDFKHKNTWEALWVEDRRNSPWVAADIA
ncbi:unnamed protein product, partial [Sphagnum jensenii]